MKRLILHVGMPKTGTTAIQKSFQSAENNGLLRTSGITYHDLFGALVHRSHPATTEEFIRERLRVGGAETIQGAIRDLEDEPGDKTAVLSAEYLCGNASRLFNDSREVFKETATVLRECGFRWESEEFNLVIAFYVRRQCDWVASIYAQWVKRGWVSTDFHDFCRERDWSVLDYDRITGEMMDAFPGSDIRVRKFEQAGDIVTDFCNHIVECPGLAEVMGNRDEKIFNERFDRATLEIAWRLRARQPDVDPKVFTRRVRAIRDFREMRFLAMFWNGGFWGRGGKDAFQERFDESNRRFEECHNLLSPSYIASEDKSEIPHLKAFFQGAMNRLASLLTDHFFIDRLDRRTSIMGRD